MILLLLKKGGFKSIQILSCFFRQFIAASSNNLLNFEKSLEILLNLFLFLKIQKFAFNNKYIHYNLNNDTKIISLLKIGIGLLRYDYNNDNKVFFFI